MVILEMLSRAYGEEREPETYAERASIDQSAVHRLAVETYELGLSMRTAAEPKDVTVGYAADIPDGKRKIVQVDDLSIGVFHHKGAWYALRNSCLHRGGPVASGHLEGDILTCPWHGYAYNVTNGQLLSDASARLDMYPVEVRAGRIHLQIPVVTRDAIELTMGAEPEAPAELRMLREGEFRTSEVAPGQMKHLRVDGQGVVVYNVNGSYFATQDECTHAGGPLEEGDLEGNILTCPVHGACFDVTTGQVLCEPAEQPLQTFRVTVDGETGRVEKDA